MVDLMTSIMRASLTLRGRYLLRAVITKFDLKSKTSRESSMKRLSEWGRMLAGGHGNNNPNTDYLKSRGLWLAYTMGMLILHLLLLSIPLLSIPMAWTLTNQVHNAVTFFVLHILKGVPWIPPDQGAASRLTHWEQIDDGRQYTKTRKFLTASPVILFFLTCFYTDYEPHHFVGNFFSVVLVTLPKLPQFHKVRLFGINKY